MKDIKIIWDQHHYKVNSIIISVWLLNIILKYQDKKLYDKIYSSNKKYTYYITITMYLLKHI